MNKNQKIKRNARGQKKQSRRSTKTVDMSPLRAFSVEVTHEFGSRIGKLGSTVESRGFSAVGKAIRSFGGAIEQLMT